MDDDSSEDFARALGDALRRFLQENDITVTDAANRMGMNKQTLSSYWNDKPDGTRNKAGAKVLFLACAELGFVFEYEGRGITATATNTRQLIRTPREQLKLPFSRSFEFANQRGRVSVSVKKPPGRVELSISIKAVS